MTSRPINWAKVWSWFDRGGDRNVAAYLTSLDLSSFDPKAPPPKTQAFWDIVDASRAPEDAELADVIDAFGKDKDPNGEPVAPVAFTLAKVLEMATTLAPKDNDGNPERSSFAYWLADRKNRRQILIASRCVAIRQSVKDTPRTVYGRSAALGRSSTRSPPDRRVTGSPPPRR